LQDDPIAPDLHYIWLAVTATLFEMIAVHRPVDREQSTTPPVDEVNVVVHVTLDLQFTIGSKVRVIPALGI
jgi:hypothetical protein